MNFGYGPYNSYYNYSRIYKELIPHDFMYGTKEALAVGTDPVLANMPCPGFKDSKEQYWNLRWAYCLESLEDDYVGGELLVVRWFPKRYKFNPNPSFAEHEFRNDLDKEDYIFKQMERLNIEFDRNGYMAWGAMDVTDPKGDYVENLNAYTVYWYAVPASSAYYDAETNRVVLPNK